MRKWAGAVLALLLVALLLLPVAAASAESGDTIVYRTVTGECYHRGNCSYLRSKIEISLHDAVARGLRPCSRCKPPELDPKEALAIRMEQAATPTPRPTATPRPAQSRTADERPAPTPRQTKTTGDRISEAIAIAVGLGPLALLVLSGLVAGISDAVGSRKRRKQEAREQAELAARRAAEEEEERTRCILEYAGRDPLQLAGAPPEVYIGRDGLPAGPGAGVWGYGWTVYVSNRGYCYHRDRGCSGAWNERNIIDTVGLRPCKLCRPSAPDMDWWPRYLEIRRLKKKYGIDQERENGQNT